MHHDAPRIREGPAVGPGQVKSLGIDGTENPVVEVLPLDRVQLPQEPGHVQFPRSDPLVAHVEVLVSPALGGVEPRVHRLTRLVVNVVDVQRASGRQDHVGVTPDEAVGGAVREGGAFQLANPLGIADKVVGGKPAIGSHDRATRPVGHHQQPARLVGPVAVQVEVETEVLNRSVVPGPPAKRVGVHEHRRPRKFVQVGQVDQQVVRGERPAVRVHVADIRRRDLAGHEPEPVVVVCRDREVVGQRILRSHHPADHFRQRAGGGALGHELGADLVGHHRHRGALPAADAEEHHRHGRHHPQHDQGDDQRRALLCPETIHFVSLMGTRCRNRVTLPICRPRKLARTSGSGGSDRTCLSTRGAITAISTSK